MEKLQRFSIRKLSIGAASCLIGTVSFLSYSHNVQAAETPQTVETAKTNNEIKSKNVQESKPNEEVKGDTQSAVVDKNTVGFQKTGAVTAVNQPGSKENTPATNEVAVINKAETNKFNSAGNETGSTDTTIFKTNTASKEAKQNIADLAISTKMKLQAIRLAKPVQTVSPEQSADSAPATPVTNKASHELNNQAQPSSSTGTIQTKLVRRPVMRLAAATATNSDELIVGKDVTVSDFSVTTANGRNEFENSHANIKFTMHADDPSALVDKRLTIRLGEMWGGFYSSQNQDSNPTTISYQGQVIGTLNYGYPFHFVYITFNNHVKDYTSINLQSDLVVAGSSKNASLYQTDLYTPTQAKDGQTYHLTNDIVIGQQKYSSNLPSTIHYRKLGSDSISPVTDLTTTSYSQNNRELYAGIFYKTPDGIYYSRSSYYSSNNLYGTKSGQPGYLNEFYLFVGTDTITDHTRSYTATFDIDQTKLSPDPDAKLVPIDSYSLSKYYWDDAKLLPNTSDVYTDYSKTYSSTATANATVTKNSVIFNQLNGQSLVTQELSLSDGHITYHRNTNYISKNGLLYLMPALFKQLQAVAESDQNLTEAINTVTTTGRDAKIKLANPIDTGVKATIKTSDGKTKEVPLLIDTIGYGITTASTAPKGAILVAAQGKTAKIYHHGDQNIPAAVDQSQLTKTITRTINVHEPDKSVTTTKQTVTLIQSVSVVDGKDVTYNGDWKVQGNSQWASYDVPSVPGYTASQSSVAQQEVTDATKDQTVNITYTANDGTQTIVYQDEDGSEVGKQVVPGKTDETVKVTPDVPDGYVVKGEIPTEVTIKPDDTPITVTVEHGKSHVTPDKPVNKGDLIPDTKDKHYPEGLTHNDLNKTVTREITIIDPTGKKSTTTQTVTFTRGATVDEVTGEVAYGNWSENGKHSFDKVDVPYITGYRASEEVPEVTVTPDSKSNTVDVTYVAKTYDVYIFYKKVSTSYDKDSNNSSDGSNFIFNRKSFDRYANGEVGIAKPEVLRGHYGESINIPIKQVQGYYVDPYRNYSNYKFGMDDITGQELSWYDLSPTRDRDLKDPLPEDASESEKENSMPRFIFVDYVRDYAHSGYNNSGYNIGYVDTEGAVISRPTNLRGISGTDTNFTAPTFEGYTLTNPQEVPEKFDKASKDIFLVYKPQDVNVTYHYVDETGKQLVPSVVENNHFTGLTHVDQKDAKTIPGYSLVSTPKQTVVDSLKDLDLYFTYKANDGRQTISYQDNGQEVGKQVITGKTDQTVKVAPEIPDGYVVKSEIPKEVIIKAKDDAIVIAVEHGKSYISSDKPVEKGDLIPGTKDKHYPEGLTHDDLNKTITREVTITNPSGNKTTSVQTVTFTRGATVDEVTGKVIYDSWSENGKHTFDKVDVPTVPGYTVSGEVPEVVVTPETQLSKVDINYIANVQHMTITYVDDTTGKTLKQDKRDGTSDQDAKYTTSDIIKQYEDQHYKLVSDSTNGKDLIFDHDDQTDQSYEVHFVHGTHTISDKRTITETINYRMSDDSKAPNKVEKQVEFNRVGKHDDVTNTDTWDKWQPNKQSFSAMPTPEVKGYTPDTKLVEAKTATVGDKDITKTITYTPNKQKAKVVFIDDTNKKTLDTHDLIGVTNGHEKYNPSEEIEKFIHDNYVFVSSDYPEKGFTYDNDDGQDQVFEAHFIHGSHAISDKRTITETITYTMSDGSTAPNKIEKQVEFNRIGKHDDVTNTDAWDEWQPNKQSFGAVPTPEVKGYTPDTKLVEAKTVAVGDKDITVIVTYTPDKQKAKVVFIDDTAKKTLDTHDLTGVTNSHEKYSPSEEIEKFIHDNYVFVSSDYPEKGFTYDNDDSKDQVFEVHLKEIPTESDTPIVPGNTEDNGGLNDTPTDSDEPEKDNGGSDTVDKSSHQTPVKRNSNKKHHGIKKANIHKNANKKHQGTETTNNQKNDKIAKLNPNEVDTKANKLTQTKLGKVQEPTNNTLPQTGNKQSGLMAALGLAISSLGMIGAVKSKKRKDDE